MTQSSILLLHPPGWDACVSGPYAAGPYLQGSLKAAGFGCRWVDLNLKLNNFSTRRITAGEVEEADRLGLSACNALYFGREDELGTLARSSGGRWTLREGFQPNGLDTSTSEGLRAFLDAPAPYDEWLTTTLAELLADDRPTFVGITLTIPEQLFGAFRTAAAIRAAAPGVPIVLGGNIPTRLFAEMSTPWVFDRIDILAGFQGEPTLAALLQVGPRRERWSSVPNIRYRESAEIRQTSKQLLQKQEFRQPDFEGIAFEDYWGFPYATVMASRGCYYGKCPFCAIPYTWGEGGFRGHDDPLAVVDTMARAHSQYGVSRFKFVEESLHAKVVDRLAGGLLAAGLDLAWEGYVRMDRPWFDPRLLAKAANAGLRKVYVGLESIADNRSALGKHDKPDGLRFLEALSDAGILAHVFVLVGHPGTGARDAIETVEFALKHRHLIDTLELSGFRYEKHTQIANVHRTPDPAHDWAMDDPYWSNLEPALSPTAVDLLERRLFEHCSMAEPRWAHPIHHMASPWSATSKQTLVRAVAV